MNNLNDDLFDKMLKRCYEYEKKLSSRELNSISLYKNIKIGNRLVLISSVGYNDEVYDLISGINHPHLPRIYDVYQNNNRFVVLMEYLPGETLAALISSDKPEKEKLYDYMIGICSATMALHGLGIIHRDIKPANVIISEGVPKLIDFSISRVYRASHVADTVLLGTPGYAAPEQFGIAQTDVKSDIYSLGITFNEMLTGCHLSVRAATGYAGRIVKKCTSTNPGGRFDNVEELIRALQWL